MLRVDCEKWNQSPLDLRQAAVTAAHARTRERFLALYEVSQGVNATRVAIATGRHHQTVHDWVHLYNNQGPNGLTYQRTGGNSPLLPRSNS